MEPTIVKIPQLGKREPIVVETTDGGAFAIIRAILDVQKEEQEKKLRSIHDYKKTVSTPPKPETPPPAPSMILQKSET